MVLLRRVRRSRCREATARRARARSGATAAGPTPWRRLAAAALHHAPPVDRSPASAARDTPATRRAAPAAGLSQPRGIVARVVGAERNALPDIDRPGGGADRAGWF